MRTQQEIVDRIKERQPMDILGFEWHEYLTRLDFAHARQFFGEKEKKDATAEEWGEVVSAEPADVLVEMADYIDFAFQKARDERGISANRSVMHYTAWAWLAEDDELLAWIDHEFETNYRDYGIPILEHICEHYALRIPGED